MLFSFLIIYSNVLYDHDKEYSNVHIYNFDEKHANELEKENFYNFSASCNNKIDIQNEF